MELDGKKVLVVGAGRSGVAASRFLAARGALVVLNDRKGFIDWPNDALALRGDGVVKLLAGDVPSWLLDQVELVVLSPGVPTKSIPARYAERAGAEVVGEVELAWRFLRGRVVGITGTNGKTTTTALVGELLKDAGIPTQVGGNIGTPLVSLDEMQLKGLHNVQTTLAALAAGLACGASPDSMRDTVRRFKPVEHRLERVAEVGGVTFYNDSKATNVDAAVKAVEALSDEPGRIVLILGGRGKNAPYAPLAPLVHRRARALVLIGEDAERIEEELKAHAPVERAADMADAVRRAYSAAEPGDTVLLAPACASFDMFTSFEHRGRVFKDEVGKLKNSGARNQESEEK